MLYIFVSYNGVTRRKSVVGGNTQSQMEDYLFHITGRTKHIPGCVVSAVFNPQLASIDRMLHSKVGNLDNIIFE